MPENRIKVSCLQCGTTNYHPRDAGGKKVVCGSCRSVLPAPGTILAPDPQQLQALFEKSSLPILVDFFSNTCGPCRMMHPVLERLARRRAGEIMVVEIDVDAHPEIAGGFRIQAVPTFVVVSKGREAGRTSGAASEENFSLWVASRT